MSEAQEYKRNLLGGGFQEAALESKRMAQKLEDERVRAEQDRIHAMNRKAAEEREARQRKVDAEKRAKIQAENDRIASEALEAEKAREKRAYRAITGSDAGFEAHWQNVLSQLVSEKIRGRLANVPSARDVISGNIEPRATFTPMEPL